MITFFCVHYNVHKFRRGFIKHNTKANKKKFCLFLLQVNFDQNLTSLMIKYIMKLSKLFEMSLFKVVMKTFEND